ncbi:hypothetical protein DFH06DRAFT_1149597 [Mycena polygramma]|nr:hypothetical protein DFH06DRAFT_1149597 [Mycena polygramma]
MRQRGKLGPRRRPAQSPPIEFVEDVNGGHGEFESERCDAASERREQGPWCIVAFFFQGLEDELMEGGSPREVDGAEMVDAKERRTGSDIVTEVQVQFVQLGTESTEQMSQQPNGLPAEQPQLQHANGRNIADELRKAIDRRLRHMRPRDDIQPQRSESREDGQLRKHLVKIGGAEKMVSTRSEPRFAYEAAGAQRRLCVVHLVYHELLNLRRENDTCHSAIFESKKNAAQLRWSSGRFVGDGMWDNVRAAVTQSTQIRRRCRLGRELLSVIHPCTPGDGRITTVADIPR